MDIHNGNLLGAGKYDGHGATTDGEKEIVNVKKLDDAIGLIPAADQSLNDVVTKSDEIGTGDNITKINKIDVSDSKMLIINSKFKNELDEDSSIELGYLNGATGFLLQDGSYSGKFIVEGVGTSPNDYPQITFNTLVSGSDPVFDTNFVTKQYMENNSGNTEKYVHTFTDTDVVSGTITIDRSNSSVKSADVIVQIYGTTNEMIIPASLKNSVGSTTITFSNTLTTGSYKAIFLG